MAPSLLVTGATGLLGRASLLELLAGSPGAQAAVLVRSPARARTLLRSLGPLASRVILLQGDLCAPGLGLDAGARSSLRGVRLVLHCAADTRFSQTLEQARAVNVQGTARLLELASQLGRARFAYASTAFVAGRRTGPIAEAPASGDEGFVNAYEQSKREAEALVLCAGLDAVVLRTSTLACDGRSGEVVQLNALHRALWLTFNGLVPMLPGSEDTPVDVVPHDWAARAVARLAVEAPPGSVLHLCAGSAAPTLGALLDATLSLLKSAPEFRRRTVARPDLVDPATWALFSRTVFETGDRRLAKILRGLESFVPQLSLPKQFETARADALLGETPPPVQQWWPRMIGWLLETRWRDLRAEEAA